MDRFGKSTSVVREEVENIKKLREPAAIVNALSLHLDRVAQLDKWLKQQKSQNPELYFTDVEALVDWFDDVLVHPSTGLDYVCGCDECSRAGQTTCVGCSIYHSHSVACLSGSTADKKTLYSVMFTECQPAAVRDAAGVTSRHSIVKRKKKHTLSHTRTRTHTNTHIHTYTRTQVRDCSDNLIVHDFFRNLPISYSRVNLECMKQNVTLLEEILVLCGFLSRDAKLRLFCFFKSYNNARTYVSVLIYATASLLIDRSHE